jgi:hypothetical protein
VLALAARRDRILVAHDFQTTPKHFGEFIAGGGSSPGPRRRTCSSLGSNTQVHIIHPE